MWDQHVGPPGYHPWWTVLGVILPLLLFAILIGLVVWAALRLTRLRYRYARGEVGRDEFFRMWRDLGAPGAVPPPAPPPAAVTAEEPGS